ncbi:hypothetical protein A2Y85_06970 [candidate division WOR-3 bacterium RBG_13_43_14]|uniref:Uncharacterized protein n=1 Tax=candidate division WOR-3 bacterium RBG_13_43_14 TaxID=1802590 RepID=A0A1F4UAN1_UNCW3|nr:MAG: hypothetical protein A2Y85_06970 [candidate division WOR-3 bacterium RBG_13_43_14]
MEPVQFKNPFVRKWADDYKEEELDAQFSELIMPSIPTFFDYPNVFLYGGSGTGKTMLLRYLSFEVQRSCFEQGKGNIPDINEFFKFSSDGIKEVIGTEIRYFGIYCKLTHIPSRLFKIKWKTKEEEHILSKLYLDLEISMKFISSITELIRNIADTEKKDEIESKITDCVKECSDISITAEFTDILEYLSEKKKQIDSYLLSLNVNTAESLSGKSEEFTIGGLVRLFFNLAEVLKSQVEEFSGVKIYILLDEYERIDEHQRILVNSLIRERDRFVEFKISSRRYGITSLQTLNPDDFIIMGRDAEIIDLEHIFRSNKAKYKKLLLDVAKKRLESVALFKDRQLTNIRELLESITPEEEAKRLINGKRNDLEHRKRFEKFLISNGVGDTDKLINIVKCDENPLIEKLGMLLVKRRIAYQKKKTKNEKLYTDDEISKMTKKFIENPSQKTTYHNLYEKNKIALLFQLINEYRKRRIYAGFDTFAALSGGFTLWFLEFCYNAVEFAKDRSFPNKTLKIDVESQRKAAEKVAWDFLDTWVKNIERFGNDIYYFTLNTGAFLRALYLDELLREPEPTYFTTKTDAIRDDCRNIIVVAHRWSVLQTKIPMKPKTTGEPLSDVHILHPILAPAFQISYRTRGRTRLLPKDVEHLIRGSEKDIKELVVKYRDRSVIQKNKSLYSQIEIANL